MKKMNLFFVLLVFPLLFLGACEKNNTPEGPLLLNMKVEIEDVMENTIYPSFLLGISKSTTGELDEFDAFDITFDNPKEGATVRFKFEATKLNYETVITLTACPKGKQTISPQIRWDYEALAGCRTPGMIDFSITAYLNGEDVDQQNLRANYRSVNECVYVVKMEDENGKEEIYDFAWMFGAYVNEDHPKIDEILQEIISQGLVNRFVGAQTTEEELNQQIFAIWYWLQTRGVVYSSITETSNPSDKVQTQYVRLFDEVYNNTQANCADGTVFLSSILKKIGIEPVLITVPGHMYLGYYKFDTKDDLRNINLLETTMVGMLNLKNIDASNAPTRLQPYIAQQILSQTEYDNYINGTVSLEETLQLMSRRTFDSASAFNIPSFLEDFDKFSDDDDASLEYQLMPIVAIRGKVQPIYSIQTYFPSYI